jgi:hypothetical protein
VLTQFSSPKSQSFQIFIAGSQEIMKPSGKHKIDLPKRRF